MLKSKLQFFMLFLTSGLFITTLVLATQEIETYIPDADKRYVKTSWNFWPKQ